MTKGTYGTNQKDFNLLKDYFLQLKVVKHGLIKEIVNPIDKFFLQKNIIDKIKNSENSLKNPAFRDIFNKLNIN